MAERGGFENHCPVTGTLGSNPSLSAISLVAVGGCGGGQNTARRADGAQARDVRPFVSLIRESADARSRARTRRASGAPGHAAQVARVAATSRRVGVGRTGAGDGNLGDESPWARDTGAAVPPRRNVSARRTGRDDVPTSTSTGRRLCIDSGKDNGDTAGLNSAHNCPDPA